MKNSPLISYQNPTFVDEAKARIDIRAFHPEPFARYLEFNAPEGLLGAQHSILMLPLEWEASLCGPRPWLICPECGRRCRYLYRNRVDEWACRKCLGLLYRSKHISKERRLKKRSDDLERERRKGEHRRHFLKDQKAKQAIQEVLEAADYGKLIRKKGTVLRLATKRVIEEIEKGDVPELICRAYLEGITKEIRAQERFSRLSRKIRERKQMNELIRKIGGAP